MRGPVHFESGFETHFGAESLFAQPSRLRDYEGARLVDTAQRRLGGLGGAASNGLLSGREPGFESLASQFSRTT